jgi:hypothetical protein
MTRTEATVKHGLAGTLLYRGPSRINGAPIVAIATFKSSNGKTGDMVQIWILSDEGSNPTDAIREDKDVSICGACPHRGIGGGKGRSCYVNAGQAPRTIHEGFARGIYPPATDAILAAYVAGRNVRLGAYGDPCALPVEVLRRILAYANGHTGYTHQWRDPENAPYRSLLMASCDSAADRGHAHSLGWRTFRVRPHDGPVMKGEIVCPASPEGQHRRTCDTCMACDGTTRAEQADVVIIGHGGIGIMPNLRRNLASLANG